MAFEKYLVILVLTLVVGIACAETSESVTSNLTVDKSPIPTIDNSSIPVTDNISIPASDNSSIPVTDNSTPLSTENSTTPSIENSSTLITESNKATLTPTTTTSTDNASTTTTAAANNVCVLIKLDLKFNNNTYEISSADVDKTVLTCNNQSATIRWGKTSNSRISYHFQADAEIKNYMISDIILTIDATDNYMNATADKPMEFVYKPSSNLTVPIGNSYKCVGDFTSLFIGSETSIKVNSTSVQFEAFRNSSTHVFSSPQICTRNRDPESGLGTGGVIVISVVCVILVLIGLIVFWRKHKHSRVFGTSPRE